MKSILPVLSLSIVLFQGCTTKKQDAGNVGQRTPEQRVTQKQITEIDTQGEADVQPPDQIPEEDSLFEDMFYDDTLAEDGHDPVDPVHCNRATLESFGAASGDSVVTLTSSIGLCTTCVSLDLSNLNITRIPPEIGKLTRLKSLQLSSNSIATLPPEITSLLSVEQFNIAENRLSEDVLPKKVAAWLDEKSPDWRCSQRGELYCRVGGFCSYAVGEGLYAYEGQVHCTGNPDTTPVIVAVDSGKIFFYGQEGPPSGRYFAMTVDGSQCRLDTVHVYESSDSLIFNCPPVQPARILSFDWKPGILLLIRGIPNLNAGPLKTWYMNERAAALMTDEDREYTEDRKDVYRIELPEIGELTLACGWLRNCYDVLQWRVRFGSEQWRTLPFVEDNFQDVPLQKGKNCLLWAGDLDGDGAPDLLLNPAVEDYGAVHIQLFLSSQFRPGQVWRPAADYFYMRPGTSESSGC